MPRMTDPVFISYCHAQADWVRTRLAPVIRASGASVTLDVIDGVAGRSLAAQMKEWGDAAAHVVAVLSPDYLKSTACQLEWKQARRRDPGFLKGRELIPLLRETCAPMPPELTGVAGPLYLDLRRDGREKADAALEQAWAKLLAVWGGGLGTRTIDWLDALHGVRRDLAEAKHVNLLAAAPVQWGKLIAELNDQLPEPAAIVDLADPENWERRSFLENTLRALGVATQLDQRGPRGDVIGFSKMMRTLPPRRLVLKNFQKCRRFDDFGADLFDALRFHAMDDGRNLTLLIHTTEPFGGLLPAGHVLSVMTFNQIALSLA
jgi:hypothetical protein